MVPMVPSRPLCNVHERRQVASEQRPAGMQGWSPQEIGASVWLADMPGREDSAVMTQCSA